MRLTAHTDYGLRVLIALAAINDRLVTIEELSVRHRVSRNHLMKVAQTLVNLGLVKSVRGRRGGLTLAKRPADIRMGSVVRALEVDMELVSCLGDQPASCVFSGICRLTGALRGAMESFFAELDRLTLADLASSPQNLRERLAVPV
ncbi:MULTISPECIES: RrF2 family transcriptional regulator [unclassified Phyllobacterium]|uniref:RrF2 family transcriptional regulator n=1 Tax=unclassified Phyllobacterium TaxID=2638441 RepID=UPI003012B3D8